MSVILVREFHSVLLHTDSRVSDTVFARFHFVDADLSNMADMRERVMLDFLQTVMYMYHPPVYLRISQHATERSASTLLSRVCGVIVMFWHFAFQRSVGLKPTLSPR
jgi:hypothetical protein